MKTTAHFENFFSDSSSEIFGREHQLFLPNELARAFEKRKLEFLFGRFCALRALHEIGETHPRSPDIGPNRQPVWPTGIIGSITHTGHFARAWVARTEIFAGVGIDSEQVMSATTAERVKSRILTPAEHLLFLKILEAQSFSFETFLTLIFSIKESAYKSLSSITNELQSFQLANVFHLDLLQGQFSLELTLPVNSPLNLYSPLTGTFRINQYAGIAMVHSEILIRQSGRSLSC